MSDELKRMWDDQKDFNRNFWQRPDTEAERAVQTKEFVLSAFSELDEVLRKIEFKIHRRTGVRENRQAVLEELTDVWKYLLSLYQVWGVDPDEFVKNYWRKSMVVRQRYSEEFIHEVTTKTAIVDIDNVLCDYVDGFLCWIAQNYRDLRPTVERIDRNQYLTCHSLMIDEQRWQEIKHHFRTSGAKARLPLMDGAQEFMHALKAYEFKIVLLTSRPIDEYPNIYADTLEWLSVHGLPYDHVWWAKDKHEKILAAGIRPLVRFAVDDELRFCERLAGIGIPTFWLKKHGHPMDPIHDFEFKIQKVKSLRDIPVSELA